MKILLTGETGTIGREFKRQATLAGHEIVVTGDITSMDATRRIWWPGVDALAHFAAAGVRFTAQDRTWADCMGVNLVGTLNLLDSITLSKCKPAVFVPGSIRELETLDVPHLWRDPYVVSVISRSRAISEWAMDYPGFFASPKLPRLGDAAAVECAVAKILKDIADVCDHQPTSKAVPLDRDGLIYA